MTFLYILLALFVFGLLVMIHELGHYLCARAFGVGIHEFSIGMGPKIFSKKGKKYDTDYSVRAFPIGGYVSMVGEDEESDSPEAFGNKKVWQRILIVIAGPLMNILLGFLLMTLLVLISGNLASNTVGEFVNTEKTETTEEFRATSPSYGLQVGDQIIKVGHTGVHTGNEVVYEIMNQGDKPIDLTVKRNGEKIVLEGVVFPGMTTEGVNFGTPDFRVYAEKRTFGNIVKHSFFRSLSTVKMIVDQIKDLVRGRYGFKAVSGPIGITKELGNAAKSGFSTFLYLVTVISVNLGVFNILPIPALDGGRLLFLLVEAVTGKPVNKNIEGYIHFAGLLILFGIIILVTCKDIAGLFRR